MQLLLALLLALLASAALATEPASKSEEQGTCSAGSEGCEAEETVRGPFLAAQYHYNSGFNDKRTRWFYKVVRLAKELQRTLVVPDFNVRVRNDTMEEHMRPFADFFEPAALSKYLPHVSQRRFRKATGGNIDLVFATPETVRRRYHLECPGNNQMLAGPVPITLFGRKFTAKNIYCFNYPGDGPDAGSAYRSSMEHFMEMSRPHAAVLLDGYDNHDYAGQTLDLSITRAMNIQAWQQEKTQQAEAQAALAYNEELMSEARRVLALWGVQEGEYAAAHWRRDRHSAAKSPSEFISRTRAWLAERPALTTLFLASDTRSQADIDMVFRSLPVRIVRYTSDVAAITAPGRAALVDQILCVMAKDFLGLEVSTFTEVIVEKRREIGRGADFL
eukprot:m.76606 g.76606  ORF g.76606 m.76606 type:complete len:389 (-) comp13186_c0_seq1:18-1184(-)